MISSGLESLENIKEVGLKTWMFRPPNKITKHLEELRKSSQRRYRLSNVSSNKTSNRVSVPLDTPRHEPTPTLPQDLALMSGQMTILKPNPPAPEQLTTREFGTQER